MFARFAGLLLAGSVYAATSPMAFAQTSQTPLQDRWPAPTQELETRTPNAAPAPVTAPPQQTAPAQAPPTAAPQAADDPDAAPKAKTVAPKPKTAPKAKTTTPSAAKPTPASKPAASTKPAASSTVVSCGGVFAYNSSHEALTSSFKAQNVAFSEVEGGPEGSKLFGSVLFPKDPKRRLVVFWEDDDQRKNVHRIVIGGRSGWGGPKGLRLGLTLAAVEKINGKPFTLSAIDPDGSVTVSDWQEGVLAAIPGDCIIGVRFKIDPKSSEATRAAANAEEYTSSDAALRAAKPTSAEILFGYPEAKAQQPQEQQQ